MPFRKWSTSTKHASVTQKSQIREKEKNIFAEYKINLPLKPFYISKQESKNFGVKIRFLYPLNKIFENFR